MRSKPDNPAVHDSLAFSIYNESILVTEQTTGWDLEYQIYAPLLRLHLQHVTFSFRELFNYDSRKLLGHINRHLFKRLKFFAVFFLDNNVRLWNLKFKSFSSQIFQEDSDVHIAPSQYPVVIGGWKIDFQSHVYF